MEETRFTPEEIEALVASGDLKQDDVMLMNRDDGQVAMNALLKADKVKVSGAPPGFPGMAGLFRGVAGALGGAAGGGALKKAWNTGGELASEMAGGYIGSKLGHPYIGMILGRHAGKGKFGNTGPSAPPTAAPKPLGGPDRFNLKGQPNVSTRRTPADVAEQVQRGVGGKVDAQPGSNIQRVKSAADEEALVRQAGGDDKAARRVYHEAAGAQKKGVQVERRKPGKKK